VRAAAVTAGLAIVLLGAMVHEARGEDARKAKLPPTLFRQLDAAKVYPALYRREKERERPSWQRFLRGAREAWMDTHKCATATLERRYRTGHTSSWGTVLATWECDRVPSWYRSFLICAAGKEGGTTYPDVWYGGSRGWQGGRFQGTDRVVGHIQVRPYHARKIVPALALTDADRTVTLETFLIITDPVNHARIAARVGVGAFAATTQAACT
jgi:hypothetical protein